jgi:ABC-type multidrug transport system fused ATPase/permease subunit
MNDVKFLDGPDASPHVQVPDIEKELADSFADTQLDYEKIGQDATFPEPRGDNGLPNPGQDPRDTTSDRWTFENHLRVNIEELRDHNLPSMTSRTSIMWKNLLVRGAGAGLTYQKTVGEILKGPVNGVKKLISRKGSPEKVILHNVDGVLRDGEMLLVLGRPGSGCSTLLKSLTGLTEEYLGWQGDIKYNGVDIDIIKRQFRGDAAYVSEGMLPILNLKPTVLM